MRCATILAALTLAAGCASQPAPEATLANNATPANSVTPASDAPATAANSVTAATDATSANDATPAQTGTSYAPTKLPPATTIEEAQRLGYKIVNEDGQQMYCRETAKLGSHLRKDRICLTADEMAAAREANQRNFENMKKYRPPPAGK